MDIETSFIFPGGDRGVSIRTQPCRDQIIVGLLKSSCERRNLIDIVAFFVPIDPRAAIKV